MKVINSSVFNLLFHNCAWLLCVLGGNRLIWLSAPLVVCYTIVLIHNESLSIRSLAVPFLLGIGVDAILSGLSVFQFENHFGLIPLWLTVLWLSFATTFSLSLKFLASNWKLAAAAGAVAMPLNYLVGEKLGAVQFGPDRLVVGIVLGLIWATLFPALFKILQLSGSGTSYART